MQIPGSMSQYDTVFHALREIGKNEGLQGLYRYGFPWSAHLCNRLNLLVLPFSWARFDSLLLISWSAGLLFKTITIICFCICCMICFILILLIRGLTPRLVMYMSQGAIFFASYEFFKRLFCLEVSQHNVQRIRHNQSTEDDTSLKLPILSASSSSSSTSSSSSKLRSLHSWWFERSYTRFSFWVRHTQFWS